MLLDEKSEIRIKDDTSVGIEIKRILFFLEIP
jgi:hypothetical protein